MYVSSRVCLCYVLSLERTHFCVGFRHTVHGVFHTLTEKTFFATLSLTFRGDEAGPFHANSVISSCGLCFGKCFFDRI